MEKLKQKLSSRKLWAAIASAILCIIAACFGEELTPEAVDILKYAVVAGVTYIFGEGIVDVARQVADALGKGKSFELIVPSLGVAGKPEEESEAEVEAAETVRDNTENIPETLYEEKL